MVTGVLGVAGVVLAAIGVEGVAVRLPSDLDEVDGLILPGGESTTMAKLARTFELLELEPGRALAAGWNRIHPDVPARSVEEFRSIEAVRAWVHTHA